MNSHEVGAKGSHYRLAEQFAVYRVERNLFSWMVVGKS